MNNKKLQDYKEYNEKKNAGFWKQQQELRNIPSGIACPKCGSEILYNSNLVYVSMPPCYAARCSNKKCNWKGYI